jgi:cation diffusion facilitator family transporter
MRVSMGVTVLIGIIELAFWFISTNILFMIEGAGNLAWLVPDLIMLYSIHVGCSKADWKMNFGYRRVETIALLFFGLGISLFSLYIIYDALAAGPEQLPGGYGPATILLSAGIIVILALLTRHIWNMGNRIGSRLLMLDSMVVRLDMASAAILLLSGVFLVFMPSVMWIQTVLTVLVGLSLLVYSGNEISVAAKELIDASPSLHVMNLVERVAEETPEILFVSELRTRSFGGAIAVEITIEIDPGMTIRDAYQITTGLEERIRQQVENVISVRARVTPAGTYVAEETAEWDLI